ncbi:dehydrogenase/reductase SDR family member 7-like [Amblyomma americanum]|uniref:11beta-hydroxysteroid dehydrogenase type 1 n=1 Tax=Amblyomma americanum TaxID=6943 RepID=A0AAQ4FPG2_AMBAM
MFFELCGGFLLLIAAAIMLGMWLMRADADLALLACEKFGRSPASLRSQVIWITGASGGIGEWLSFKLAKVGANLVISGTNVEKLHAVGDRCLELGKQSGCELLVLPFDLADVSCHADQVKAVVERFGRVDVLINNAGKCIVGDFEDYSIDEDKAMFDVNVFGHVSLTRLVIAHAKQAQRNLHVVVTSSMSGVQGSRVAPVYAAAKHAVEGYFESLMVQGKVTGEVDVTVLCLGPVLTSMTTNVQEGSGDQLPEKVPGVLKPERCAELTCAAIANKLEVVWICENPLLVLFYLNQYLPIIYRRYIVVRLPWNRVKLERKKTE